MAPSKAKTSSPSRSPWYAGGLRFECRPDCGACCTSHENYAYIYLEPGDVERLAEHFGRTAREWRERHVVLDDGFPVLKMQGDRCPFLEVSRCTVYAARPVQCRTFPFWSENLVAPRRWRSLRGFCPGIDRGPLHRLPQIKKRLEMRDRDG